MAEDIEHEIARAWRDDPTPVKPKPAIEVPHEPDSKAHSAWRKREQATAVFRFDRSFNIAQQPGMRRGKHALYEEFPEIRDIALETETHIVPGRNQSQHMVDLSSAIVNKLTWSCRHLKSGELRKMPKRLGMRC